MARAGNLDQRITFQSVTLTDDGMGGSTEAWADVSPTPSVWANVQALRGGERVDADRVTATGMYVFTIRNRSDISEANRIVWNSENYNIRAVQRLGAREMYLKIEAERGAA